MAKRIFEIRSATNAEVEGVKNALRNGGISYYETPRGNFGKSMAAFWVENDEDFPKARDTIEQFQNDLRLKSKKNETNGKIEWKYIPLALFILIIVFWMLIMGYTR